MKTNWKNFSLAAYSDSEDGMDIFSRDSSDYARELYDEKMAEFYATTTMAQVFFAPDPDLGESADNNDWSAYGPSHDDIDWSDAPFAGTK